MKILLSAYACEPNKGSEPGVGWHWAIELAKLGHEVEVLTRVNNRKVIEAAVKDDPVARLHFHYYDVRPLWSWWKRGPRGVQIYYWLWQRGASQYAKVLVSKTKFDLIHHITFGVFRQPSYMGRLGIPFVVGPVGGAETTPPLLRRCYPLPIFLREWVRDVSNRSAFLNPSLTRMYRDAILIFCKTSETAAALPKVAQSKTQLLLEIGVDRARLLTHPETPETSTDFLYAGSLVYWKGLHLALRAFAELKKRQAQATFTIIGIGRDESRLKALSNSLRIANSVHWLGWVPQEQIWHHYRRATAFVYPSLHDSSGNVLLEALSQGLPVICLDTGGPGTLVPASCGIKIPVRQRHAVDVVTDISNAMGMLIEDRALRSKLAKQASEYARDLTWAAVVSSAYSEITRILQA